MFLGYNNCLQDIGSSIIMKNKYGNYYLRGIFTSHYNNGSIDCAAEFSIFVKVSYYLPFIIKVVESVE